MLILFLFSLVGCQNLIKNPSFEQVDSNNSNNNVLNWVIEKGTSLSSVSHSGKYSLHWGQNDKSLFNYHGVNIEKNNQYEACAFIKLINITKECGFQMTLQINNQTAGIFEFYRSRIIFGNCDW